MAGNWLNSMKLLSRFGLQSETEKGKKKVEKYIDFFVIIHLGYLLVNDILH